MNNEVSILKIGASSYNIKDATARTDATSALTKINGATISGTYTSATETIEIGLTLGS